MKHIIILITICIRIIANDSYDYTITEQDLNGKTITIENNNYKLFDFSKRITDIRLNTNDVLSVDFIDDPKHPFSKIKIFGKSIGDANALITFSDNSTSLIHFKVLTDIRDIHTIVKAIAKDVIVSQVKDTIILKGIVKNNKIKNKIIALIKDTLNKKDDNIKVIDLLQVKSPDKMVRLKLYIAEINNNKGETIKNNWTIGYKNYLRDYLADKEASGDTAFIPLIANSMDNAVTLTGGLTAGANYLGNRFNTGLTLNYLKNKGIAKVLDETTLLTLEDQNATFHAGGTINIRMTKVSSSSGDTESTKETIPYGLDMKFTVNEIINDKYIQLDINTNRSDLDWVNSVDGIPSTKEKTITTNVIVENKSTIILGGLINNNNSKDWEKIPFLGDIPILGVLFRSRSFQNGKSELVFFITPTIVEANTNTQPKKLEKMKNKIIIKPKKIVKKIKVFNSEKTTNEKLHEQRLKEYFGI